MSIQGIILIDMVGAVLLAVLINLVRKQRMFVGYGIIWLVATGALMILVSVPPLLAIVTRAVGALFPVSALTLLAFVFIVAVLIFFSVKMTTLSNKQTELIQVLALADLRAREARPSPDQDSSREQPDSERRS